MSRRGTARFDWDEPSTWAPVLAGADLVYAIAAPTYVQMRAFAADASAAGARRLVLLSGRGTDTWGPSTFGRDMVESERAVRDSELSATIVRPSNFDQNFDEDLFHAPLMSSGLRLPAANVSEPFVDVEDVAEAVTALLLDDGHDGHSYDLTGPRSLTFGAAVEIVSRAAGRELTYTDITREAYVAEQVSAGVSTSDAVAVADMFALLARGLQAEPLDHLATVLGRPPRSFEDYAVAAASRGAWDAATKARRVQEGAR